MNTDLYRTPYPSINRYGPVNYLSGPLRRPLTLLRPTTDLLRPLTETPYPPTNCYRPANRFYRPYKTSATRSVLYYTI